MSLEQKIMAAMKDAMKAKDQAALRGLRAIKSAILLAKTEKGGGEMDEAAELKLLQKLSKQRKDSIAIFEKEGRDDLAATEREEVEVIERFLPEMMSEEEVKAGVEEIIAQTGASSMKDMGKVMGMANQKFAGKADNSLVAKYVKEALAG